jgi:hypothetical protein
VQLQRREYLPLRQELKDEVGSISSC